MIVVLIIGILLAIAIPNFIQARESSRARACVGNLKQIDSAKQQAIMDNKLNQSAAATFSLDGVTASTSGPGGVYQLVTTAAAVGYIRRMPVCPEMANSYLPGSVTVGPLCKVSDSAAPHDNGGTLAAGDTADYGYNAATSVAGRWYHGL